MQEHGETGSMTGLDCCCSSRWFLHFRLRENSTYEHTGFSGGLPGDYRAVLWSSERIPSHRHTLRQNSEELSGDGKNWAASDCFTKDYAIKGHSLEC